MNVFELFATLGIDTSQYDEGLASAESKGSSFGQTLGTVVATGAKVATVAIGAATAATVAGTAAFINGVSSVGEYADAIDKNSQKLGLSIEKYQQLDYVLSIAGTSIDSTKMGMKTLTNTLDDAQNGSADAIAKFQELGFSLEDIQNMSREDVFENVIYAFQNMEDSVGRAALANDLLGKSSVELAPLLNMTNEETQSLMETASEYGMIMDEEAVKAGAQFNDSLTTMQKTLSGLKNNLLSSFLPSFSKVMDGLAAIFAGDDSGLGMINEGVADFIENLNEIAPKAMEIGASILTALITSISTNLPILLSQGGSVLQTLIQGIISALPSLLQSAIMIIGMIGQALLDNASMLFSTALQLILMLANALTENAPAMIPAIVSVVHEIATVMTEPDMLSLLISAALQLILALAEGILLATPDLISIIPEVYANVIQTVIAEFPSVISAVVNLLGILGAEVFAIIGGLMNMNYNQIASALSNAFSMIKTTITNGLNTAKSTVESILNAIKNKFSSIFETVKTTVENAINFVKGLFDFEWSLPDIKLPHFTVTGSLDLLVSPPKVPSLSVSWYQKAMEQPYMLNGATIFGAAGGKLLGAGESGSELVVGTDKLMSMMREAVGANARPVTINVYGAAGQDIRELAKEVGKELQNIINDKENAYA